MRRQVHRLRGLTRTANIATFVAVLALVLTGCEEHRGPEFIDVASTASEPVSYRYGSGGRILSEGPIRDIVTIEVNATVMVDGRECTDFEQLRIVSDGTGDTLHTRDFKEDPVCDGDRLIWDGTTLRELDDGGLFSDPEPWPDDIYDE